MVDLTRASPDGCARMLRLLLLAVIVIGLAPGTFVRTTTGVRSDVAVVTITSLAPQDGITGPLTLTGTWELTSPHGWFGGFSALTAAGGTSLIAGSDRGWLLDLDLAGHEPRAVPGSFRFVGRRARGRAEVVDLESLARDPASGTLWAAFENFNLVERLAPDGTQTARRPPEMRGWSGNSGPETMERFADGRFLILAEGSERSGLDDRPALLFPGDPLEPNAPLAFRFVSGPEYDPVDATQLPDGRVLVLLRRVKYTVPAQFDTVIAVADPALIRPGEPWDARVFQRLSGPLYGENFEGIAFVPDPADPARGSVWLIADDNFSMFQRNLLLRFAWDGKAAQRAASSP